jgi:uncharacterized membrane protein YsdA (DUF1294 family)
MAKEKNYNPLQAQQKADKARALKKGKRDPNSFMNSSQLCGVASNTVFAQAVPKHKRGKTKSSQGATRNASRDK